MALARGMEQPVYPQCHLDQTESRGTLENGRSAITLWIITVPKLNQYPVLEYGIE